MLAGRGGAIVNVGSVSSFVGFPGASAYVASKHGLVGLTSTASAELASRGIRVNLVCPGIIDTPMHRRGRTLLGDAMYDQLLAQRVHTRRAGQAEEIARSIVFLCSSEASYITGTTLTADGGLHLTL
jgi:NAD(P)-dependent dehydrogenase (short-subunit alcohol dehydrogenase family)